jgi:hypothetical protein
VVVTPRKPLVPLAQIQTVCLPGRLAVAGQETGDRLPHRKRIESRCHYRRHQPGFYGCHCGSFPSPGNEPTCTPPTQHARAGKRSPAAQAVIGSKPRVNNVHSEAPPATPPPSVAGRTSPDLPNPRKRDFQIIAKAQVDYRHI